MRRWLIRRLARLLVGCLVLRNGENVKIGVTRPAAGQSGAMVWIGGVVPNGTETILAVGMGPERVETLIADLRENVRSADWA